MARIEKTVFISYRRTNVPWALAIYKDLTHNGYDVFFDYEGIGPGDFESVILDNIKSRAHFIVILTPSALERCGEPSDWLRREIEFALENERNIVPLMLEGFDFGAPKIASQLTGGLADLRCYNGLDVPASYFDAAMDRLREKHLSVALDSVVHPASASAKRAAADQKRAAAVAPEVEPSELTAQEWFERGFYATDLDEKVRCYTEAIRINPDYADAYVNRGIARNDQGDLDGAVADYDEAIRIKPDDADAYYNRGIARKAQGDLDGAVADCNEAIRINPDYANAYVNRGIARNDQGDLDGAVADYDEAIRIKPDDADAYYNRGIARKAQGDLDGAMADYDEAIRINPDYAAAYYNRGVARKAQGDLDGAVADYDEALRINPDDADAYFNRGGLREQQSDASDAIADYQTYLDLGGGARDGDQVEVEERIRKLKETL